MKRHSGYYATQRRPGARATSERSSRPTRRFVEESHAVGYRSSTTSELVVMVAAIAVCVALGVVWARRPNRRSAHN
jgi:cobalamin biosynthesis Mg chelatase CobN